MRHCLRPTFVGALALLTACERPAIRPYECDENRMPIAKQMLSAPVILVGRILSSSKVGRPRHYEVEGIRDYAQLYQVTVAVENVLKGDAPTDKAVVYFFLPAGSYVGMPLLGIEGQRGTWHLGDREMFFLNRDSGVLRYNLRLP